MKEEEEKVAGEEKSICIREFEGSTKQQTACWSIQNQYVEWRRETDRQTEQDDSPKSHKDGRLMYW